MEKHFEKGRSTQHNPTKPNPTTPGATWLNLT
jgi:hypothetical protein